MTLTEEHTASAPRVRVASSSTEPVVAGFHPDPTVCRVGEDYYLAHSSFEYFPGVPLWHSRDLLRWTLIGNALGENWSGHTTAEASKGIYAPTLRHRDGRFLLITTDVSSGRGQLVTTAADPAGEWSDPVYFPELRGIDPDLAWDEDGTCYITYCSSDPAAPGIAQAPVDLATGTVLAPPRTVWRGTGLAFPEAPHLYRREGWWYLVIAEGGTERGHAVSVARARRIDGPFEAHPRNPVFSHRSTSATVQNAGHADLVDSPDGTWSAVYLGTRPRGVTPMFHVNGRETFIAGVDWVDGWPVFDEARYDFEVPDRSFEDRFGGGDLHPRWVSAGPALTSFCGRSSDGLQVRPSDDGGRAALLTRVMDERWSFTATGSGSSWALVLRFDDAHGVELRVVDGRAEVHARIGPLSGALGEIAAVGEGTALRLESAAGTRGAPDDLILSVVDSSATRVLARLDGRYFSTEVAGGFTGRMVGVRALDAPVVVHSLAYSADDWRTPAAEPRNGAV